jgi:hypothetical protein
MHYIMSLGRRAYFPVPMRRLAPMHNTLHPQLDPRDAPHVSFGSRALAVSLVPPRLLSYCVTQPLSASCLCATPASCSPSTSAPRAAPKTAASPHPCMCRYCCTASLRLPACPPTRSRLRRCRCRSSPLVRCMPGSCARASLAAHLDRLYACRAVRAAGPLHVARLACTSHPFRLFSP